MRGIVHALAKGGCGVIHCNDRTVFLPGVIIGETVEFVVQGKQKGIWQGKLQRILEPSPQRLEAPCRHYRECGGCNLQHMAYQEQLRCKENILSANIKKIAGIIFTDPMAVLPSPPFHYRSKMEFQVQNGTRGFFQKKTHRLVPIRRCLLLSTAADRFFLDLPPLPAGSNGLLQILSNGSDLAARLQSDKGAFRWLTPRHSLFFDFPPYRFQAGPEHFIQANIFLMQSMLELLNEHLPACHGNAAADLFCGCGFFTLALAKHFQRVLALESNPDNLVALRTNLESNHINNVEVCPVDVLKAALPPLDLVVLDPPRGGLSAAIIARVARAEVKKIIYFSCDSATFARDLRMFSEQGYDLRELKIIDNFPQTDHFEIFSLLGK